jgi:hypothetical protein
MIIGSAFLPAPAAGKAGHPADLPVKEEVKKRWPAGKNAGPQRRPRRKEAKRSRLIIRVTTVKKPEGLKRFFFEARPKNRWKTRHSRRIGVLSRLYYSKRVLLAVSTDLWPSKKAVLMSLSTGEVNSTDLRFFSIFFLTIGRLFVIRVYIVLARVPDS